MDVRIHVDGAENFADLRAWLNREDELRGRVRSVDPPIHETALGAIPEILTVALSAGGAGTVLASSLRTWLVARRTAVKLTVKARGRSISLDITSVDDVLPLLRDILKATGDE